MRQFPYLLDFAKFARLLEMTLGKSPLTHPKKNPQKYSKAGPLGVCLEESSNHEVF